MDIYQFRRFFDFVEVELPGFGGVDTSDFGLLFR